MGGGGKTGDIETAGDEHWFRVELARLVIYEIELEGTPVAQHRGGLMRVILKPGTCG